MSLPDHLLDEPEELPCRECYDREHRPKAKRILHGLLEDIDLDDTIIRSYLVAAHRSSWWSGFVSFLDAAYFETLPDRKWSTCSRCASEARADAAEPM